MLTVDTVYDQNMLTRSSPGAARGWQKREWKKLVNHGSAPICQFLRIFYSVSKQFKVFGIKDFTVVRYTVDPRYNELLYNEVLVTITNDFENNIPFPSLANHFVLSKFWKVDLDRRVTR